jgi:PKD repeat protein
MRTTMSHLKLSSSLSVKSSVLMLVVMVAGVLCAAPSSAMAQQITATSSPGLPLPMFPLANETGGGGGGVPELLPPTTPTGDTVFSTNETVGITPPLANETVGITPPLANETVGITPPPTVGVAAPLTAEITANTIEGDAPLTVELSAVVAGGTAAYTYVWDFGDGSAVTGILEMPTVQHIFENAGIYTVAVTVTDATGQQVTPILEITVNEPPPPAEEPPAEEPPAEEPPAEEPPAEEPPITGT